jgi:hypothetical protein
MDQLIVDDEIAACRQRRKKRGIGNEAATEIKRGLAAEEVRRFLL